MQRFDLDKIVQEVIPKEPPNIVKEQRQRATSKRILDLMGNDFEALVQ